MYPRIIRKSQSLSPLGNHCLFWGNCIDGMYSIAYQSYINITKVHSRATATFLHCCMVAVLTQEFDIMLNSPSGQPTKAFRKYYKDMEDANCDLQSTELFALLFFETNSWAIFEFHLILPAFLKLLNVF